MADTEAFDAASEAPDFIKEHAEDIYAVFTMSEANCYMEKIVLSADAETIEELKNCIEKDAWDFLPNDYKSLSLIPSKMFLTPKKKHSGGNSDTNSIQKRHTLLHRSSLNNIIIAVYIAK